MNQQKLEVVVAVMLWTCWVAGDVCTQEDVDCGAIILQEAVKVVPGDTELTLCERVKLAEHRVFPQALELLASGAVTLDDRGKVLWHRQ